MEADLQPAISGVVPDLVVDLGMAVVELCEASVATPDFEFAQLWRKLRLDALAQPGEEVSRGHGGGACQLAPNYLVQFRSWLSSRPSPRTKAATVSAPSTSTRACSRTASSSSAGPSTTWWRTLSWRSSSTLPRTTLRRTYRSTSTLPAARSVPALRSTTRCSTSRRLYRPCASGARPALGPWC